MMIAVRFDQTRLGVSERSLPSGCRQTKTGVIKRPRELMRARESRVTQQVTLGFALQIENISQKKRRVQFSGSVLTTNYNPLPEYQNISVCRFLKEIKQKQS